MPITIVHISLQSTQLHKTKLAIILNDNDPQMIMSEDEGLFCACEERNARKRNIQLFNNLMIGPLTNNNRKKGFPPFFRTVKKAVNSFLRPFVLQ